MAAWGSKRGGASRSGPATPHRRHGRRPIRSSITGPDLPDLDSRVLRFEIAARGALDVMRHALETQLRGVQIGFSTVPMGNVQSDAPMYYSVDRTARTIVLYRMPIQRARVLHVDDAEHRRLFIEHCVYRAVCDYLGRDPWDLLPGRFDHY
ncbi:MAG: hypothetical protein ACNYNX_00115 [Leucobacter sp.]